MTIDDTCSTEAGRVSAHMSALAEATAELVNGLRRLSTPDDLAATLGWAMDEWPGSLSRDVAGSR